MDRDEKIHGQWQIGDRCCYWWKDKKSGETIHKPAVVVNLTKKRIVVQLDSGSMGGNLYRVRATTVASLEPAHKCTKTVGRGGAVQHCLLYAGHEGDCA